MNNLQNVLGETQSPAPWRQLRTRYQAYAYAGSRMDRKTRPAPWRRLRTRYQAYAYAGSRMG